MHKLLRRQTQKYLASLDRLDPQLKVEFDKFFAVVSQAYQDFDADRKLLEWSQELSSKELLAEKNLAEEKSKELEVANAELLQAQASLVSTSKLSALGEMAGGVAHEINTPLATIQLLTGQMKMHLTEETLDKEMMTELSNIVLMTVDRISTIVKGLRKFSRDGRGDPVETVPVQDLINDTLSFCHERIRNSNINLEVVPCGEMTVTCRSTEIAQVLLNLLNNAFDAIQSNQDKWIKIEVSKGSEKTVFQVTDSGNGIPSAIVDKLMQPFFTTKEIGKGTGLGLSISKGIVEGHGGRFYIDAECPNTRFVFEIPN